jgi:hypothetical protein
MADQSRDGGRRSSRDRLVVKLKNVVIVLPTGGNHIVRLMIYKDQ